MALEAPILDGTTRKAIDRALLRMHRLLGKLDQMQACGVECDEYRAVAQYLCQQFEAIKTNIFAGQPPAEGP